jgi:membrane protein YqaA with SNARE-associated domain
VGQLIQHVFSALFHLGGFGLVLLGILDSSFLMMPLGNDLLLVALTAQHKDHLPFYIVMGSLGSSLGVFLLDLVARKGGEEGLSKLMDRRKLERLKKKIKNRALLAIEVACLAPPPFPFTPVVAAASAFGYPRPKLLLGVFLGRAVRFTLIGLLAARFGTHIIKIAKSPAFTWVMVGFIVLCTVGSVLSVMRWVKGRHSSTGAPAAATEHP